MDVFTQLQQEFLANQVLPPSIEEKYRAGLRRLDDLVYSTDETIDTLAVYFFDQQLDLVASGSVAAYFFLGYVGHGDNSNTVTLNIHTGQVAVMLQFGFGPLWTNFVACRVRCAKAFLLLDRLLANVPEAGDQLEYIVAYSDVRRGAVLLKREPMAAANAVRILPSGWSELDHISLSTADGAAPTIDGGLFEWREPIPFEHGASKFLVEIDEISL